MAGPELGKVNKQTSVAGQLANAAEQADLLLAVRDD